MELLAWVADVEIIDDIRWEWEVSLRRDSAGQFIVEFRGANTKTMKHFTKQERSFATLADAYTETQRLFSQYKFPSSLRRRFRQQLQDVPGFLVE